MNDDIPDKPQKTDPNLKATTNSEQPNNSEEAKSVGSNNFIEYIKTVNDLTQEIEKPNNVTLNIGDLEKLNEDNTTANDKSVPLAPSEYVKKVTHLKSKKDQAIFDPKAKSYKKPKARKLKDSKPRANMYDKDSDLILKLRYSNMSESNISKKLGYGSLASLNRFINNGQKLKDTSQLKLKYTSKPKLKDTSQLIELGNSPMDSIKRDRIERVVNKIPTARKKQKKFKLTFRGYCFRYMKP